MKFNRAFSLAEMMVVMLIASVVLAASAPMITKRVQRDQINSDVFDVLRSDEDNTVEFVAGRNQRIFMNTDPDSGYVGIVPNGVTIPQGSVYIGNNTQVAGNGFVNNTALGISTTTAQLSTAVGFHSDAGAQSATAVGATAVASGSASAFGVNAQALHQNSVAIGSSATANTAEVISENGLPFDRIRIVREINNVNRNNASVAIGASANATTPSSVAVGYQAQAGFKSVTVGNKANATASGSVALGYGANATTSGSVALGNGANATASGSVALGNGANATASGSVALGNGAEATIENTIVLGNSNTTVYIPGNLVIDHSALVGRAANRNDNLYFRPYAQEDGRHFAVLNAGDWKGDDSNVTLVQDDTNDDKLVVRVGPYSTATEWWDSDYDDNNRTHINFEDSTKGDNPGSHEMSDIRLKNVGEEFKGGLEELSRLNFYHFTFKKDEKKTPQVGVMAQDLQKVFPDAVTADEEGWLHIRWDEMFYAVINAVKELNAKVCALAEDIMNLKNNDKTQDEKIAQLVENSKAQEEMIKSQAEIIKQQQEDIKKLCERVKKLER